MKTKFLLPGLAMIFAIGMSFASVKTGVTQDKDYVHLGGNSWQAVNEIDCGVGGEVCRVQFGEGGPIYDLYDEKDLDSRKISNQEAPFIINP